MPALPTFTKKSCKNALNALLARLLFLLSCANRLDTLRVRLLKQFLWFYLTVQKRNTCLQENPGLRAEMTVVREALERCLK
jgi:hypothetical protein